MRLIDIDTINWHIGKNRRGKFVLYVKPDDIDNMPTIDPVRHGRWVDRCATEQVKPWEGRYKCTECGVCIDQLWYLYCPHCGARMDGDDDAESEQ